MALRYRCWMGWTPYESLYAYATPQALGMMGFNGEAYGMYMFDYQYGLVPFMEHCVAYNSARYVGFNQYIALGAGNSALVNNTGLHNLFIQYANDYTQEFCFLQDLDGIEKYLNPIIALVKQNYNFNLKDKGEYVLGTAFSMSIRSGANPAYLNFANGKNMTPTALLQQAYALQGQRTYDAGRWESGGSYSQYDACFSQMAMGTNVYIIPYKGRPPVPPSSRRDGMPIWMMIKRY